VGRGQLVKVLNQLAVDELPRSWRPADTALRADLMLFFDLVPVGRRRCAERCDVVGGHA